MWSFPVLQRGSYPRTARSLVNSRRRVPCASRVHEWHHLHLLTPTHSLAEYAGVLLVPKEQHSVFWIYQTWHPERLLGLQVNPSLQHCCKELTAISLRAHKIQYLMNTQDRWVLSRKLQYASAHLILITNTQMSCSCSHFTGRD